MRNSIFIIALCATLSACSGFFDQTVNIDPPAFEKNLVIHQLIGSRDSVVRLNLTRNFGILETTTNDQWHVTGAVVELFENGQRKLTFVPNEIEQWVYEATVPGAQLISGASYEIRVEHPNYPAISATQVLPAKAMVDSAILRRNGGISPDGYNLSAFEVTLQDPPDVKNYYMMQVFGSSGSSYSTNCGTDSLGNYVCDTTYFTTFLYPEGSSDRNVKDAGGNALVVDDAFFDGQKYKFVFRASKVPESNIEPYTVIFRSITEDYYRYLLTSLRKADSEDFPLADPVTVFGNVKGGIGIFGMYDEQILEVQ